MSCAVHPCKHNPKHIFMFQILFWVCIKCSESTKPKYFYREIYQVNTTLCHYSKWGGSSSVCRAVVYKPHLYIAEEDCMICDLHINSILTFSIFLFSKSYVFEIYWHLNWQILKLMWDKLMILPQHTSDSILRVFGTRLQRHSVLSDCSEVFLGDNSYVM